MLFVFIQYNVSIYAILHNEYWFITWKIYQNSSASKLYLYMVRELDSCFNRQQIMKTSVFSIAEIYILCLINMYCFGMGILYTMTYIIRTDNAPITKEVIIFLCCSMYLIQNILWQFWQSIVVVFHLQLTC